MIAVAIMIASMAFLAYTFAGYAGLLWIRAKFQSQPVHKTEEQPTVSFLIACHNEEHTIERKIRSIFASNYAPEKIQIVVISDGSTDRTNDIISRWPDHRVVAEIIPERRGKAAALNAGMRRATGEICVFSDARQILERNTLRSTMANFGDPSVGCVSGQLMLGAPNSSAEISGEQLKWHLENRIRELEGLTSSVIGALGAYFAARRCLLVQIPDGTLLDDCYLPLSIVKQGYRTVFEKDARVWDDVVTTPAQEFRRKVRTLTGNYQLMHMLPWLLSRKNPVLLEFVSHKLCRLMVPFALMALLFSSLAAPFMPVRLFGVLQLLGYCVGCVATAFPKLGDRIPFVEVARSICVLSYATLIAFMNFLTNRYSVWTRETASKPDPVRAHANSA